MSHDISSISSRAAMGHLFFTSKRVGLAFSGGKKETNRRIVMRCKTIIEVSVPWQLRLLAVNTEKNYIHFIVVIIKVCHGIFKKF